MIKFPVVPQQEPYNVSLGKRAQEGALEEVLSRPLRKGFGYSSYRKKGRPSSCTSVLSRDDKKLDDKGSNANDYHCKEKHKGVDSRHHPSSLKGTYRVNKGGIGCCTKYSTPNVYVLPKTNHPISHIYRQKNSSSKPFKVVLEVY